MELSMSELQYKLQNDKYSFPTKTLLDVYNDNKNDSTVQKDYIILLERYLRFFKNSTIYELTR